MDCPACGAPAVTFSVPEEYREHAPAGAPTAAICTRCLTVCEAGPSEADEPASDPDFTRLSDAVPPRSEQAVPLALALGLCSSLATNREAIATLLEATERAGADPLLVLDRLLADPTLEPAVDLERRRHQLEQLLY